MKMVEIIQAPARTAEAPLADFSLKNLHVSTEVVLVNRVADPRLRGRSRYPVDRENHERDDRVQGDRIQKRRALDAEGFVEEFPRDLLRIRMQGHNVFPESLKFAHLLAPTKRRITGAKFTAGDRRKQYFTGFSALNRNMRPIGKLFDNQGLAPRESVRREAAESENFSSVGTHRDSAMFLPGACHAARLMRGAPCNKMLHVPRIFGAAKRRSPAARPRNYPRLPRTERACPC